ncbi:unnamed protein product [Albugo candida]|uniref:Uncharacterized protein n=1 Tax=Albugo candida TaxID=65357 RepID=A0A024GRI2_9STRA|nr:unnamed protein product [Albugo candida]|eukprot:CCI49184.1 unnamed protein product [Albugo candida]
MEFLVHNISHSDLIVQLSNGSVVDTGNEHIAGNNTEKVCMSSVLARPKFSLFQQVSQSILDSLETMLPSDLDASALVEYCDLEEKSDGACNHNEQSDCRSIKCTESRKASQSGSPLQATSRLPIGFKLGLSKIPVKDMHQFRIRDGLDTFLEIREKWQNVAITAVYFPLVAFLMKKWLQVLQDFKSNHSKQLVYLISGAGVPHNIEHPIHGNSTEGTGQLIALFIRQFYPTMKIIQVHSGSNIFRYDDNVLFMTRELRPQIEAHRDKLVEKCGEDWKSYFHLTIAYTDGPPARLSALNASLRIYKPSYLHIWQVKRFWHERKVCMEDIDFHSFEKIEASASVAFTEAEPMVQLVVQEMCIFRDQFLQAQGKGEVESFWLRKSRKPVLAVLLVEKHEQDGSVRLLVHRGMNCEVSMPTGSLCAERNAIGSALAQDPTLCRRSLKMIAVLGVNLLESKTSVITTTRTITDSCELNPPRTESLSDNVYNNIITHKSQNEGLKLSSIRATCQMTLSRAFECEREAGHALSPSRPKRPRTFSIDDYTIGESQLSKIGDRNPLAPCGACKEWLMKIAEANPSFRVITFENADCHNVYISQIM